MTYQNASDVEEDQCLSARFSTPIRGSGAAVCRSAMPACGPARCPGGCQPQPHAIPIVSNVSPRSVELAAMRKMPGPLGEGFEQGAPR